jgi:hypothetical protein
VASAEVLDVARRAEQIYEQRLRTELEKTHRGYFVCIEPDSGDYFLGSRMEEATAAARKAHPGRLTYILRIGFPSSFEIGYAP